MTKKVTIDKIIEAKNYFAKFPQRKDESKNSYYKRLSLVGLDLSRTSLQYLEKALEIVNDKEDNQAILAKYTEIQRARNEKSKEARKHIKTEQQKMNIVYDDQKNEHESEQDSITECDPESLRIRVSFELGETARKAIDGLLALVGVKL